MRSSLWLVAVVALGAGCPRSTVPVETSGSVIADSRAADLGLTAGERRALASRMQRKLALLRASDPDNPGIIRLEQGVALLDTLDGIEASADPGRDKERDALAAMAAWLEESPDTERAASTQEVGPDPGPWGRALGAFSEGRLDAALEEGLLALTQLVDAGVDSATLRYRLAEWALAGGDGELAAELFDGAVAVEAGQEWIAQEAPLQASRARNLSLGPDGAALAEARTLVEQGRLGEGWEALNRLIADGNDGAVVTEARELAAEVMNEATAEARQKLARAEQILSGPGPYGDVPALLDQVASLPPGAWQDSEHLRIQGWYRNRAGASTAAERAAAEAEQASTLSDARDLVVAGKYRAALLAYAKLDTTPLRATARKESKEAAETLVREERERAGGLFVAARKQRDPAAKAEALREVEAILAGLIEEFPQSAYVERLSTNLAAVRDELSSI